jgi:6-pyruvoyltetrahydropterin/6-carboxytetrahydropterin synthase
MYFLEIAETFSAAHALRNYPGVCARIHGHNWKIKIGLKAEKTDNSGITADYAVLKKMVDELVLQFDHNYFNDHPYFKSINPTSENISKFIYTELEKKIPPSIEMDFVQISETSDFSVMYRK